ncbi:MAG: SGNH/GDSL hydrolase family protein [Clostridia bacterium]|nr:SGNH/GDSL hydrolase family protein [Clostridia bacterium]
MKIILLIGDSIRLGYDTYTKMAFENSAQVYFPKDNCRFTGYIIRHLYDWKNELNLGDEIDLVHWNAGLWDDLVMLDGKKHTSLEVYKENVDRICNIIKILFPNAKMIFATSTPVQEELFTVCKRYNKDTEAYNAAAIEIVKKHGGEINDLYTLMNNAPVEYHSDLTHYYTKEGTKLITNQVINCIEKALDIESKSLDYDKLFAKKEEIIGI